MTALAARVALDANCPYTKVVCADNFLDFTESGKCTAIKQVFDDAYRSSLSVIILDGLEQLLEYVPLGSRFNPAVLQTMVSLLKKQPPPGRKLIVIATTSDIQLLKAMKLLGRFSMQFEVPQLTAPSHLSQVFSHAKVRTEENQIDEIAQAMLPISIKHILLLLHLTNKASDGANSVITAASLLETYQNSGLQLAP